jgi:hypothetical protein
VVIVFLAVGQPTDQDDVVWDQLTQLYTIHAKGRLLDLQTRIYKYGTLTVALGFVRAVECESLRRRRLQDNGQLSKAGGLSITLFEARLLMMLCYGAGRGCG